MDREHLFRGINANYLNFTYGSLITYKGVFILDEYGNRYEVKPETVGEYTGKNDKNGKPIYEGDIIRHNDDLFVIKYSVEQARFLAVLDNGVFNPVAMQNCEIVGNIHENPDIFVEEDDSIEDDVTNRYTVQPATDNGLDGAPDNFELAPC